MAYTCSPTSRIENLAQVLSCLIQAKQFILGGGGGDYGIKREITLKLFRLSCQLEVGHFFSVGAGLQLICIWYAECRYSEMPLYWLSWRSFKRFENNILKDLNNNLQKYCLSKYFNSNIFLGPQEREDKLGSFYFLFK